MKNASGVFGAMMMTYFRGKGGLGIVIDGCVRDFAEITRAGVDAQQGEESNESAYAELVEFVRVGVQLLFEDLAAARQLPAPSAASLH